MRAIKKLDQAIIDTESGKACKYSETLVDWYQRSVEGEEDQIVLPDLQRMRESQARVTRSSEHYNLGLIC